MKPSAATILSALQAAKRALEIGHGGPSRPSQGCPKCIALTQIADVAAGLAAPSRRTPKVTAPQAH